MRKTQCPRPVGEEQEWCGTPCSARWCAHTHRHKQPPTASPGCHPAPKDLGPPAGSRHRHALLGIRRGPFLLEKLCKRRKLAEIRDGVCPATWGRECQTSEGRGEGRGGTQRSRRGGGALTTQPGAGLGARGSALLLLRAGPRGRQPGVPAHMPGHAASWGGRAGGGTPPAVGPGAAPGSGPPWVCAPQRPAVPGGALLRARPLCALCPLPSVRGRLPASRGPAPCLARTLRRPARPALRLRASARS